jgi:hypothetical protein
MELEVSYSLENAEQFWTGTFDSHDSLRPFHNASLIQLT